MPSQKVTLTTTNVTTLPIGKYYDDKTRGLILNVTPTSRTYQFYGWLNGKPIKKVLGKVGSAQLKIVREMASAMWATPVEEPKSAMLTLGEVAKLYAERCAMLGNRTIYTDKAMDLYWDCYRDTPLNEIETLELTRKHNKIANERGKQAARFAITSLRTLFAYAIKQDKRLTFNPALGVDTAKPSNRDVSLKAHEIKVMYECLEDMAPNPRHFFKLALLTGLRRSNVERMQWAWINFEEATVTIPAEYSKNGKEMCIPLVPEAVQILQERKDTVPYMGADKLSGPYVFQGRHGSGKLVEIQRWVMELKLRMRAMGVDKDFHTHDLRRTAATRMLAAGVAMPIISKFLGHVNMGSTKVYTPADVEMVRAAQAKIGAQA